MSVADLYQEIILDHYRHPQNYGELPYVSISVEHENPLCGDKIKLMVSLSENGKLEQIKFHGHACAICTASSSMMTQTVVGKNREEIKQIIQDFLRAMREEENASILDRYGDLVALKGVIQFPVRIKCATLPWHALEDALSQKVLKNHSSTSTDKK